MISNKVANYCMRITIIPHEKPKGPVWVPSVMEEIMLTRPARKIQLVLDRRVNNIVPNSWTKLLYDDQDAGKKYNLDYYKVAKVEHAIDYDKEFTVLDLVWKPHRSDDLRRYTFTVVTHDDLTYQFADTNPDGSLDYWYNGKRFKCVDNKFYAVE